MGGKKTKLSVTTSGWNEAETELKNHYYILPPVLLCVGNAHEKTAATFKVAELDELKKKTHSNSGDDEKYLQHLFEQHTNSGLFVYMF